MACNYCGENRFRSEGQRQCHISKNHAEFACTCFRRYTSEDELNAHKEKMQKNAKEFKCSKCCRSFAALEDLYQHKRAKSHWKEGERQEAQQKTGKFYCHDKCGRSFTSKEGLYDHTMHYRSPEDRHRCNDCLKTFQNHKQLAQHVKDTDHKNNVRGDKRNQYVVRFYEKKVKVDPGEKKEAVSEVTEITRMLINYLRKQPGGKIYSPDIRKAGSHAANTKIGKPNEFDINIQLIMKDTREVTRGKLGYEYVDTKDSGKGAPSPNNMNVDRQIEDIPEKQRKEIPIGAATVKIDDDNGEGLDHLNYKGDIVPAKVKQDFYRKMKTAIANLGLGRKVYLSRDAHGPAITITIVRPGNYDINVDMVPTISSFISVSVYEWPRPDTRRTYTEEEIQAVLDAGLHLVPKKDTTWYISFSKAETALLSTLDRRNGCHKAVLKCVKKILQDETSKSSNGLPGISSHLAKNSLFWTIERLYESGQWDRKHFAERLIDVLDDFEKALRSGKMPYYFNTSENLLQKKNMVILHQLADRIHKEKMTLIHM